MPQEYSLLPTKISSLDEISAEFRAGFAAGFSASFDGWNGEVFIEFNRSLEESPLYIEALVKAYAKELEK